MNTKAVSAVLVPVFAALLAGCGGATTPATPAAPSPTAATTAAHNDADVTFVQGMISHHQQAVTMADLAATRSGSDKVKQLAGRISQAQGPEIIQMQGYLASWGVATSAPMTGMNHGTTPMSGMMSDEQMTALDKATGPDFDRLFLQMMIEHHNGAIQMADTELKDGQNAEVKNLAQKIIDAQQAEITEMSGMFKTG